MGLNEDAKSLKTYTLPFNDRDDITASARPYIYLMYEKKIMLGDNENAKKQILDDLAITKAADFVVAEAKETKPRAKKADKEESAE